MNKHILSVLVVNNSGVLSRISGLFSRRGYNIDSLTVGPTDNKEFSRMTITVTGDNQILEQIKKQLNKLIEVIKRNNGRIGVFPVSESSWKDIGIWNEYLQLIKS